MAVSCLDSQRRTCAYPTPFTWLNIFFEAQALIDISHARHLQASLASLESALPAALGIKAPAEATSKVWDALCDQVLTTQQDYNEQIQGPWRRLWYGIGNTSEVVDAWIEVIPSEYGLAVVKTGVAVIFKVCSPISTVPTWFMLIVMIPFAASREIGGQEKQDFEGL